MDQLEMLREDLSQCDEILLNMLLLRSHIIERIMACKEANKLPMLEPLQEEMLEKWLEKSLEGKRHRKELREVYDAILRCGRKIQAGRVFDYNIVLIGFMGAGKSTVSSLLSSAFAMERVEMDEVIAAREAMSISDIFETRGEEYFRSAETSLLIEMQSKKNVVISCGGGVPLRERNVAEMKKNGKVVLLTAKPETVLERVKEEHVRPIIEDHKSVEFIAELMADRREKYEAAADIMIATDGKSALDICNELVDQLMKAQTEVKNGTEN